jgi:hypothetical protein
MMRMTKIVDKVEVAIGIRIRLEINSRSKQNLWKARLIGLRMKVRVNKENRKLKRAQNAQIKISMRGNQATKLEIPRKGEIWAEMAAKQAWRRQKGIRRNLKTIKQRVTTVRLAKLRLWIIAIGHPL